MARFLAYLKSHKLGLLLALSATVLAVVASLVVNTTPAHAAHYNGWFTAYAMGNRTGADPNVELTQGHFANHYYQWCPGDPAAFWLWGTRIDTDAPIGMSSQWGGQVSYSTFYLHDIGDPTCSQGNYWVDIYFGRWENRPTSDPSYCCCGGVTCPGFCYAAGANPCSNAQVFGRQSRGYTGP